MNEERSAESKEQRAKSEEVKRRKGELVKRGSRAELNSAEDFEALMNQ